MMADGAMLYCAAIVATCVLVGIPSGQARAVEPTATEMAHSAAWIEEHLGRDAPRPPFSFVYCEKASADLLPTWERTQTTTELDRRRTQRTVRYSDAETGMEVRCEVVAYTDYPGVEWTVYFSNQGDADTLILEDVYALDMSLTADERPRFIVHHARGSMMVTNDFEPLSQRMRRNSHLKIFSNGMSSSEALPFFNVQQGDSGVIAGLGWSAPWSAEFARDTTRTLTALASADPVHLLLRPGEHLRTPKVLLLFWEGERIRAHNVWRRLLLDHHSPRPGGSLLQAPLTAGNWGRMTAEQQIAKMEWWSEHDLPVECFWIDAGWSGRAGLAFNEWGVGAANRVPRPDLYPDGMKPVSDAAHRRGMKFLLWVWPHTVIPGVEVAAEHPDWVVTPGNGLDHGIPEVNAWMIERYGTMIEDFGMDVYRQDGHIVVTPDESPDRQGLNLSRYEEGFYAYWDALLERHPDLIIDNCAAGGRKIDLETLTRSICLWRSDYQVDMNFDPVGMQGQTYGLSFWVPLSGGVSYDFDPYMMRSGYSPAFHMGVQPFAEEIDSSRIDFDVARKMLQEYLDVREYFYGDYYPLTPYSLKKDLWMAWQFNRPDLGGGMVQAFRREESPYRAARFALDGLEPEADYKITNVDGGGSELVSGRDLTEEGLVISLNEPRSAAVIRYQRAE